MKDSGISLTVSGKRTKIMSGALYQCVHVLENIKNRLVRATGKGNTVCQALKLGALVASAEVATAQYHLDSLLHQVGGLNSIIAAVEKHALALKKVIQIYGLAENKVTTNFSGRAVLGVAFPAWLLINPPSGRAVATEPASLSLNQLSGLLFPSSTLINQGIDAMTGETPRSPTQNAALTAALLSEGWGWWRYGKKDRVEVCTADTGLGVGGKECTTVDNPSAWKQVLSNPILAARTIPGLLSPVGGSLALFGVAAKDLTSPRTDTTFPLLRPETLPPGSVNTGSQLAGRIGKLRGNSNQGEIEIITHEYTDSQHNAKKSYTVVVQGTQFWGSGGGDPQDLQTNLKLESNLSSGQERAVQSAMKMAGIKPGEPVEMIGHSQGGGVVTKMAADPIFAKKYNVVSVASLGGPTGGAVPAQYTKVIEVENMDDFVPRLDGRDTACADNITQVQANTRRLGQSGSPHDVDKYVDIMKEIETSDNPDLKAWRNNRTAELHLEQIEKSTSRRFLTKRI